MQYGFINKHLKLNHFHNKQRFENVNRIMCFVFCLLNKNVHLDVIRSAFGTFVWLIIIITWNVLFQVFRTKMGPAGDYLTFVIPRGYY